MADDDNSLTSPVHSEPMACSEPPTGDREGAFKDLLIEISQKMDKENVNQLAFRAGCNLPGTPSAIEVLKELRKQGVFSPRSCANIEALLRKISRWDLADLVVEYMEKYPAGKRHASVQEKRSNYPITPIKRCATDPPALFRHHQHHQSHQANGILPDSPQVCQEETSARGLALNWSSSSEVTVPTTSTPKTPLSSPDHSHPVQDVDEGCTPIVHAQPNRSYLQSSPEPFVPEQLSYQTPPPSTRRDPITAKGAQYVPHRSSRSATVSREGSFRSLYSSASSSHPSSSLAETISKVANTAIDAIARVSQQSLDDRYVSSSSFSTKHSSRYNTDSDTRSVYSESEGAPKRKSRSSYQRQRRRKSTHQHQDNPSNPTVKQQYAASSSENEVAEFEISDAPSDEGANEDDGTVGQMENFPVTYRKKNPQEASAPRRRSTLSFDQIPRPPIAAENRRFSYSVPDSFKRQSVASDATSEATITPHFGRDMQGEEAQSLLKERPPLWKKLLRSKTRFSPSFTWKVGRKELIKPVWLHHAHVNITRPNKLELDINHGKHNPKLTFQLFPYGLHGDEGEAVTMAVRIATPDKCPPLPLSSEIQLQLVVWGGEGREKEAEVRNCPAVHKELSTTSVFYVYQVITHDQLKRSKCKHFYLEMKVTCSGL